MRPVRLSLVLLVILLSVFALTACSKSPTSPSQSAFVQFRLDQNSCTNVLGTQVITLSFFVDGILVGTAPVSISTTSPPYSVVAGTHAASANVTNTNIRWDNLNFSVTAKQTFTVVLLC
jgi:hypothetical protein